jgi:hypothetical protein
MMTFRMNPFEEMELPSSDRPVGARDNGLDASRWEIVAELEGGDVSPVLSKLAAAGIGAYAVTVAGLAPRGNARRRLYVDGTKYDQASDVLMIVLRGKENRDLGDYVPSPRRPPKSASPTTTSARSPAAKIALRVGQGLLILATAAILLAIAYEFAVHGYARLHPPHHQQDVPGIHQAPTRPVP